MLAATEHAEDIERKPATQPSSITGQGRENSGARIAADYSGSPGDPGVGPQGVAAVHGRPHARHRPAAPDRPTWRSARPVATQPSGPGRRADPQGDVLGEHRDRGRPHRGGHHRHRPHAELPHPLPAREEPALLRICTLLDKPARRLVEIPVDYIGFEFPDQFVVGYGLDYGDAMATCAMSACSSRRSTETARLGRTRRDDASTASGGVRTLAAVGCDVMLIGCVLPGGTSGVTGDPALGGNALEGAASSSSSSDS